MEAVMRLSTSTVERAAVSLSPAVFGIDKRLMIGIDIAKGQKNIKYKHSAAKSKHTTKIDISRTKNLTQVAGNTN